MTWEHVPIDDGVGQPHNPDAEDHVLAWCLRERSAIEIVLGEGLNHEDFGEYWRSLIFGAMVAVHKRGQPITRETVATKLRLPPIRGPVDLGDKYLGIGPGWLEIDRLAYHRPDPIDQLRMFTRIVIDDARTREKRWRGER